MKTINERTIIKSITRISLTLTLILSIFALPSCLGGGFHKIVGMSMFPTVQNNDIVCVLYGKKTPKHEDLVTLEFEKRLLIKRLIGLPGDTLVLHDNCVIRNGELLPENFIYNNPFYNSLVITLEDDQYFVLGDNREVSLDSRIFGPVHRKDIKCIFGPYIRF